MKRAVERNDMRGLVVITRELDRRFYRLGAGVSKKNVFCALARREIAQLRRQLRHRLVVEIAAADVQELACLLFDGLDDFGMGVSGARDRYAGHEIEK